MRGEKPDFWPVSKKKKIKTGSLPLRGILPLNNLFLLFSYDIDAVSRFNSL